LFTLKLIQIPLGYRSVKRHKLGQHIGCWLGLICCSLDTIVGFAELFILEAKLFIGQATAHETVGAAGAVGQVTGVNTIATVDEMMAAVAVTAIGTSSDKFAMIQGVAI
jgi:hypothetical protein